MPPVAISETRICNQALTNIGVSKTIASLDESSKEARTCALWYETSRNTVLTEMEWGFAQRRVTLAARTDDPPEPWGYHYAYPAACLKVTRIDDGRIVTRADLRIPFQIEGLGVPGGTGSDIEALRILTDQVDAVAVYTAVVANPALYPPAFVNALVWRLAADIAMPLAVAQPLRDRAEQYYGIWLSRARANDLREAQDRPEPDSEFIQARDGARGYQYPFPWDLRRP